MYIADEALLTQFESGTLPVDAMNHVNHLRIAWLYLRKYELALAIEKVSVGTREFAEGLGDTEKYHQTITEAVVRIMFNRLKGQETLSFDVFLSQNQDMVSDLKSLLKRHYTTELLESADAELNFAEPDKRSFD